MGNKERLIRYASNMPLSYTTLIYLLKFKKGGGIFLLINVPIFLSVSVFYIKHHQSCLVITFLKSHHEKVKQTYFTHNEFLIVKN